MGGSPKLLSEFSVGDSDGCNRTLALLGVFQASLPSLMSPMASAIYNITLDWFPGTWALAPVALMAALACTFGMTYFVMGRSTDNINYTSV